MIELMLYEGQALKIALYYRILEDVDGVHITIRDALHNDTWELRFRSQLMRQKLLFLTIEVHLKNCRDREQSRLVVKKPNFFYCSCRNIVYVLSTTVLFYD